jgi:sugar lactone lactonase YvrE
MGIAGCGRFGPGILTLTQERLTTGAFSSNYRTRKVSPTGATVDAEGFVWLALWDGWQITRYDPKGRVNKSVRLPVKCPTCPTFGGPKLETIYVTSAFIGLSEQELLEQPHAGILFAFEANVCGLPEVGFNG